MQAAVGPVVAPVCFAGGGSGRRQWDGARLVAGAVVDSGCGGWVVLGADQRTEVAGGQPADDFQVDPLQPLLHPQQF